MRKRLGLLTASGVAFTGLDGTELGGGGFCYKTALARFAGDGIASSQLQRSDFASLWAVPMIDSVQDQAPAALPALPEGVRAGNENLVKLTAAAGAKVAALIAREGQGEFLRIAISGGGCNGLSYKMKFVPSPKRGDILVSTGGAAVLVDSKSALYLKGTHLDYSAAMVSGGFKFSNPNAKASCSCGESFSV